MSRSVEVGKPRPNQFRSYNAFCRAMDEWTREQWAALDAELREICS